MSGLDVLYIEGPHLLRKHGHAVVGKQSTSIHQEATGARYLSLISEDSRPHL